MRMMIITDLFGFDREKLCEQWGGSAGCRKSRLCGGATKGSLCFMPMVVSGNNFRLLGEVGKNGKCQTE